MQSFRQRFAVTVHDGKDFYYLLFEHKTDTEISS